MEQSSANIEVSVVIPSVTLFILGGQIIFPSFASKHLTITAWFDELPLYPVPFQGLFGRGMHFIAHLRKR